MKVFAIIKMSNWMAKELNLNSATDRDWINTMVAEDGESVLICYDLESGADFLDIEESEITLV